MGGLIDFVKSKTGIGQAIDKRKRMPDEVDAPVQPAQPAAVPA